MDRKAHAHISNGRSDIEFHIRPQQNQYILIQTTTSDGMGFHFWDYFIGSNVTRQAQSSTAKVFERKQTLFWTQVYWKDSYSWFNGWCVSEWVGTFISASKPPAVRNTIWNLGAPENLYFLIAWDILYVAYINSRYFCALKICNTVNTFVYFKS